VLSVDLVKVSCGDWRPHLVVKRLNWFLVIA
jgi:hypothetical protein